MAPATSSAFLISKLLHVSSVVQESDVPLAFIFNSGGKSVFWNFQHSPIICRCPQQTLQHHSDPAILSALIYVAVLSKAGCLDCSTHGFAKALTSEEAPASIQMCCQLTYQLRVCLFTRLSPASATLAISLKSYPVSLQDC